MDGRAGRAVPKGLTANMSPEERRAFHEPIYRGQVEKHEENRARFAHLRDTVPGMAWYYDILIDLEDRMIERLGGALESLAKGEMVERERPERRPYVPTRPGETGYQEPPNPLDVLAVALSGGSAAEFVSSYRDEPDGDVVPRQADLF